MQDGFLAAALAGGARAPRPRIDVYDTSALGAGPAYQKRRWRTARRRWPGPLIKEELASLVASQSLPLPTLALNALGGDTPPAFLFQFALDPEQEARAAARRIAEDGHVPRGIALFPRSTWGDRLYEAFTDGAAGDGRRSLRPRNSMTPARATSRRRCVQPWGAMPVRVIGLREGEPVRPATPRPKLGTGRQFVFIAATAQTARAIPPAAAIPDGLRPPRLRNLRCLGPGRAFGARPRRPDFPGNARS